MLKVNEERAVNVFSILLETIKRKELVWFRESRLPQQRFLPEELRKNRVAHSRFLWFSALFMRGAINDDMVFGALAEIYRAEPEIFDPEEVLKNYPPERIKRILNKTHFNYKVDEICRFWWKNALGLKDFAWNPLNVFEGAKSYRGIWQKLIQDGKNKKFFGWREKIVSLLTTWYEEAGFIPPLYGPPPFDFHVGRITINTRVIDGFDGFGEEYGIRYEKVRSLAMPLFEELCWRYKFHTPLLSSALWLCSRNGCRRHPNRCCFCPLEEHCFFFVPAVYYYGGERKTSFDRIKGGKFVITPRVKEQKQLFLKL